MKDKSNTHGQFRLIAHNPDGSLRFDTGFIDNLGMTVRLPVSAGLYVNTGSQTAFTYLALGSSATAVSAAQTTLVAEITTLGLGRASATASRVTTNSTNDTSQLTYSWTASGNATINEIGYFNAASVGVMGGRALTGTLSVANGVVLTAVYQIIHT